MGLFVTCHRRKSRGAVVVSLSGRGQTLERRIFNLWAVLADFGKGAGCFVLLGGVK